MKKLNTVKSEVLLRNWLNSILGQKKIPDLFFKIAPVKVEFDNLYSGITDENIESTFNYEKDKDRNNKK